MLTLISATVAACYVFVGGVLYRALAIWLLRFDGKQAEFAQDRDLLLRSVLPGLCIVGTAGTYLALFKLLRAEVIIVFAAAVVILRRHDAFALLRAGQDLCAEGWHKLYKGNVWPAIAIGAFCLLAFTLFSLARVPASNVDTWAFQLPLAQSMAAHHGFIYPQIDSLHYSSFPLFFNLLFAEGLVFVDHFTAAGAMNVAIYLGFLLAVASFARPYRWVALLVVLYFIAAGAFFSAPATKPLTDVPRSCYSVLALLFVDQYLRHNRLLEIVTAGLLVGAAVAGKYTEALTLGLIGLCLMPGLLREKRAWIHACAFCATVFLVAGYWYIKNWVLLGNPIFPFVFGHPGISDDAFKSWIWEMTHAWDPADRIYNTNLLTLRGWNDFLHVIYLWFFVPRATNWIAAALIVFGLVIRVRVGFLAALTVVLFVVWYAVMFNSIRWAMPAYLLFLSTASLSSIALLDRLIRRMQDSEWHVRAGSLQGAWSSLRARTKYLGRKLALASGGSLVILAATAVTVLVGGSGVDRITPHSINDDLNYVRVAVGLLSIDEYLASDREGYRIYRYIGEHDLRYVLQPFDVGATGYVAGYNGTKENRWVLNYTTLPTESQSLDSFLEQNHVRYFIDRPTLAEVDIQVLGGEPKLKTSRQLIAALIPRSHVIMADNFGWRLYEINRP
jgi:hypothetical protein